MGITGLEELGVLASNDGWTPSINAIKAGDISPAKMSQGKTRSQGDKPPFEHSFDALRLLMDIQADPVAAKARAYASYISDLLGASLDKNLSPKQSRPAQAGRVGRISSDYDLVVWAEPAQSRVKRLLFGLPVHSILERVPTSLLVGRQPSWPLRQILLIVRSEEAHGLVIDWTIRLAQASGARVTALVVVPLFSPLSGREARFQQRLEMLLAGDSLLERQVKYVSQRLAGEGVEASLQLRQGSPEQQIRAELEAEHYDLIVVAAESKDWWLRCLIGETVEPVLNRANCPVLIAKPFQA